jgi:hypothetical protein
VGEGMTTMRPPSLTLSADCLCSKWGFNDGDMPDVLMDYWDELDSVEYARIDWHAALRTLVREHLVPAMEAAGHTVEVYDIETIHNPIRARLIDGVEIDDYDPQSGEDIDVTVTVPYEAIARACSITP